jgi:hypothetical protein
MNLHHLLIIVLISILKSCCPINAHSDNQNDRNNIAARPNNEKNHIGLRGSMLYRMLTSSNSGPLVNMTRERCKTDSLTPNEMKEVSNVVKMYRTTENSLLRIESTIEVETYFHVITADGKIGEISDTDLQNQLNVLNNAFSPHGFTFTLMQTTRTMNSTWYYAQVNSQEEYDMKSALRVGNSSALNVYFNDGAGVLGYSTTPYSHSSIYDGVVVRSGTIPGGDATMQGKTLVHEAGHWFGLEHTFRADRSNKREFTSLFSRIVNFIGLDDCFYNDDGISDTPSQSSPTSGCPRFRNSCPFQRGWDPIRNFMDYSSDSCYNEFTSEQVSRMKAMWNEYRAP